MSQLWIEKIMPTCAVCNKTVERLDATMSPAHFSLEFVVHCHGDRETMILPHDCDPRELKPGVAFSQRRLTIDQIKGA